MEIVVKYAVVLSSDNTFIVSILLNKGEVQALIYFKHDLKTVALCLLFLCKVDDITVMIKNAI